MIGSTIYKYYIYESPNDHVLMTWVSDKTIDPEYQNLISKGKR